MDKRQEQELERQRKEASRINFAVKILPLEYMVVHMDALAWLLENHKDAYEGFCSRITGGASPAIPGMERRIT
jgi:hypothetical protein